MSKYPTKTEKMQFCGLLLNQIHGSAEMQEALKVYGINAEKLNALLALYTQTVLLFEAQIGELGDQLEATRTYKRHWHEASVLYTNSVKIARIVFRNNLEACQTLQLNGERKTNLLDWYDQAKIFYNAILSNISYLESMQQYNYSLEIIKKELAQVEEIYKAYLIQKTETAEAVQATENRDKKFDELYQKVMDLKTVVKIAFNGRIEWLKAVGL